MKKPILTSITLLATALGAFAQITYHSNGGGTSATYGNITYHSKGGTSANYGGNITYHSNGGTSATYGNTTYHSQAAGGGTSTTYGNITYHSNGRGTSATYGSPSRQTAGNNTSPVHQSVVSVQPVGTSRPVQQQVVYNTQSAPMQQQNYRPSQRTTNAGTYEDRVARKARQRENKPATQFRASTTETYSYDESSPAAALFLQKMAERRGK
jgi:hypothetical protein